MRNTALDRKVDLGLAGSTPARKGRAPSPTRRLSALSHLLGFTSWSKTEMWWLGSMALHFPGLPRTHQALCRAWRRMDRHRGVWDGVLALRGLCSSLRDKHTNSYCSSKDFPAENSRKNSRLLLPVQLLASCVTWGRVGSVSVPQGSSGF